MSDAAAVHPARRLAEMALPDADSAAMGQVLDELLRWPASSPSPDDLPSMFVTDKCGRIVWVNAAFTALSGYSAAEAVGCNARLLRSGAQGKRFYRRLWQTIFSGRIWSAETINSDRYGFRYVVWQSIFPISHDGEITHYLSLHRETPAHRIERIEAELRQRVDPASGMLTAAAFMHELAERLQQARASGRRLALLSLCDNSAAPDKQQDLVSLSACLQRNDLIGRFGPSHVGVLPAGCSTREQARDWVRCIGLQSVHWQIGIAIYPQQGELAQALWLAADDDSVANSG